MSTIIEKETKKAKSRPADEENIHEEAADSKRQRQQQEQPQDANQNQQQQPQQQLASVSAPLTPSQQTKTFASGAIGNKQNNIIQENDLVIVYISDEDIRPVYVTRDSVLNTRFGSFPHNDFVGNAFGNKLVTTMGVKKGSQGFIYLLKPTPLLWTRSLRHRTQILYHADIALIISMLNIKTGSRVVEAGTGSGSLSHSIARQVLPSGRLFTFEFHEQRFLEARKEFTNNGLFPHYVTITHRDVCEKGFLLPLPSAAADKMVDADVEDDATPKVTPHTIDAVFLDLPKPWECVENAALILKEQGGKLCTFSPCIEQVQKACAKMSELNFIDIKTVEILAKDYQVHKVQVEPLLAGGAKQPKQQESFVVANEEMRGHTGYLTFATRFKLSN